MPVVVTGLFVCLASERPSEDTYCFGRLGRRLTATDLDAISRAAAVGNERPWAVFGSYSQVLPEIWYVDAFLPPTRSADRVRRGAVRHLECRPAQNAACLEWHVQPKSGGYVQIADGRGFDEPVRVRRSSERPILVDGEFSDQDLASLVLLIRSKPTRGGASGPGRLGVSGTYPIRPGRIQLIGPSAEASAICFATGEACRSPCV